MTILQEFYRFRFLALALAHRELTVRYKRSIFGILWSLAEPVLLVVVYAGVFGIVFGAARTVPNYPLFSLFGLLPWLFFSSSVEGGTGALLENAALIRKIYFPRELLIVSVVFSRLTTLLFALVPSILFAGVFGDGIVVERLWWLVPGLAIVCMLAVGVVLGLSALNVILRDVQFIARFVLRLAFYAVPVVYPREFVPPTLRHLYDLNPLVAVTVLFQGVANPSLGQPTVVEVTTAFCSSLALLLAGWIVFRKLASAVADAL